MLNTQELAIIREALPYNGTKLIKAKLHRVSNDAIREALSNANPEPYRKDIIDAALEVIKEHRAGLDDQRTFISELSAS